MNNIKTNRVTRIVSSAKEDAYSKIQKELSGFFEVVKRFEKVFSVPLEIPLAEVPLETTHTLFNIFLKRFDWLFKEYNLEELQHSFSHNYVLFHGTLQNKLSDVPLVHWFPFTFDLCFKATSTTKFPIDLSFTYQIIIDKEEGNLRLLPMFYPEALYKLISELLYNDVPMNIHKYLQNKVNREGRKEKDLKYKVIQQAQGHFLKANGSTVIDLHNVDPVWNPIEDSKYSYAIFQFEPLIIDSKLPLDIISVPYGEAIEFGMEATKNPVAVITRETPLIFLKHAL